MTQDLGSVFGSLLGGKGGSNLGPLIQQALSMLLSKNGGNMQGLLDKLNAGGLGQQAQSWVGTGPNEPVTGQQLTQALGADNMQELANKTGVSVQDAADGLAKGLPQVVDKLSPQGQLPDAGTLQQQLEDALGGSARAS